MCLSSYAKPDVITLSDRIGEGYLDPETGFHPVVSKTFMCPSSAPLMRRSPFEAKARDVTVFWWL
jgi:hypothetical protein